MKKCKFLSILFVFTLLLVSCEKQEELNLNDPNHRIIVTSEMDFENKVIVGGDIDFGDISRLRVMYTLMMIVQNLLTLDSWIPLL